MRFLVIVLVLFGLLAFQPGTSIAKGQGACNPTLTSSPNPSTVGQTVTFSGDCYFLSNGKHGKFSDQFYLNVGSDVVNFEPDTSGHFSATYSYLVAGTYTVQALEQTNMARVVASTTQIVN